MVAGRGPCSSPRRRRRSPRPPQVGYDMYNVLQGREYHGSTSCLPAVAQNHIGFFEI